MKKFVNILKGFFSLCLILLALLVNGQQHYKLDKSKSSLKVTGTSTVHDWTMVAGQYDCKVDANYDEKKDLKVNNLSFQCKTTSIASDHSLMNDKAHEALKAGQFSDINFRVSDEQLIAVNGGTVQGTLNGELQIAGKKNSSRMPFQGTIDTDGNIQVKGSVKVKMSAFNVKAPTAMMGTIKTGDEVSILYEFFFKAH